MSEDKSKPACPKCQCTEVPFLFCNNGDHFIVGCTHCHHVWRVDAPKPCPACDGTGIEKGCSDE
jgi:uncharacterized Zn finger protein